MPAREVAARRGRGVGNGAEARARARGRALRDAMSGRYSFRCPDNAHARHLAGVTDSDKDFLRETKRVENPLERTAAKALPAPAWQQSLVRHRWVSRRLKPFSLMLYWRWIGCKSTFSRPKT